MNIWDCASADEVVPGISKAILRELAAHPSTQHVNEMFIKLGAMFGKDKTWIWAGIFDAASNGFLLLLGCDGDQETEKDPEHLLDSMKQETSNAKKKDNDDGPRFLGKQEEVKLLQMEQIAALTLPRGPAEFNWHREHIKTQLTSMEENLKSATSKGKSK
jgi:hypothetical protein